MFNLKRYGVVLSDGTDVTYGLLVWSTGVGPSSFIRNMDLRKAPGGRVGIDEWLKVPLAPDVCAIGDCSGYLESTGKATLKMKECTMGNGTRPHYNGPSDFEYSLCICSI